jgi:hypothetical protein
MGFTILNTIIFGILLAAHYFPVNRLEKKWFSQTTALPKSALVRPNSECSRAEPNVNRCMGMPSGHTEAATIFALILFHYGYMSAMAAGFIVAAVGAQRILFQRHTISQVLVGAAFGLAYSIIYCKLRLSIFSLFVPLLLIGVLSMFLRR